MRNNQFQRTQYSAFTLVEMMVVILIIGILFALGSWGGLFSQKENAQIEEISVNLLGLIDQEKTSALLGKTEGGEIVRKRKITVSFNDVTETITYTSYADLAKDAEDTFKSGTANNNTALTTKSWTLVGLSEAIYPCPLQPTPVSIGTILEIIFTGDTMQIVDPTTLEGAMPHLIFQIARNNVYREIHIDRRTGMSYERAGIAVTPSCN